MISISLLKAKVFYGHALSVILIFTLLLSAPVFSHDKACG